MMDAQEIKPEIMWAIHGEYGFYAGTQLTRRQAIDEFTNDVGKTWNECRKKGDRAVKVKLIPVTNETDELTALRAENARLRAECEAAFSLLSCVPTDDTFSNVYMVGFDEALTTYHQARAARLTRADAGREATA